MIESPVDLAQRPLGVSSRIRLEGKHKRFWRADNGQQVALPMVVDYLDKCRDDHDFTVYIQARIDLVGKQPELVEVHLQGNPCLDPIVLQRFFRWATALEIVRHTIPQLLAKGIDPYSFEYATEGYPDAANLDRKVTHALSDDFLMEIASQYLEIGHGYAKAIAGQRGVSERTVVSWVQKARKKGFLQATSPGKRSRR